MTLILILVLVLLVTVAYGAIFGAPYLPTQKEQINHVFKLLELKSGDTVVDLGCGDGKFLLAAHRKGFRSVGYEINPLLFMIAKIRAVRHKNSMRVFFMDVAKVNFSDDIDGIYTFLMTKKLIQLEGLLRGSGIKVVSYAYKFPNQKILKSEKGLNLYQF